MKNKLSKSYIVRAASEIDMEPSAKFDKRIMNELGINYNKEANSKPKMMPIKRLATVACVCLGLLCFGILSNPLDEPQNGSLTLGEAKEEHVIYKDNNQVISQLTRLEENSSMGSTGSAEWVQLTKEDLKKKSKLIVTGTIESLKEYAIEYKYLDQNLTSYWTELDVRIDQSFLGDKGKGTVVRVLYELTYKDCQSFGFSQDELPKVGESYYFFLCPRNEMAMQDDVIDYSIIGDYFIVGAPVYMTRVGEKSKYVDILEKDYGTVEEFIEKLYE